jgi:iron(III) transport system substrate-binding protein
LISKIYLSLICLLLLVSITACGGKGAVPAAKTGAKEATDKPMSLEEISKYTGPDRQERLVKAAKQEGELLVYTSIPQEYAQKIADAFEKKYGVKPTIWRASAVDVALRVITESRGGRFAADIVEANSTDMETVNREKLLQAVDSPYAKELIPEAISPDKKWYGSRLNITTQAYNTTQIKKEELPKTYEDLLDPKWKGRIVIESKSEEWFADVVKDMGEEKGLNYFKKLAATNGLPNRKGKGLLTEMVAAGEVPIALTIYNYRAEQLKSKGAPIDWFVIEPAVARVNSVAIPIKAPHPNAAMLFHDFMLSDVQNMMVEMDMVPANTKVATNLNKFKMKIINTTNAVDEMAKWDKLFEEIILKQKTK